MLLEEESAPLGLIVAGHTSASIASQTEAQKQESVRISALRALQCERSILVPLRAAHPGETRGRHAKKNTTVIGKATLTAPIYSIAQQCHCNPCPRLHTLDCTLSIACSQLLSITSSPCSPCVGEEIVWGKPLELAVASRGLGSAFPLAGFDDGDNYTENRRVEMRLIAPGEEGYYAAKPPPLKAAGTRRRSVLGRKKKTEEEEGGQTRGDPNLRFKLIAAPDKPVIDQLREQMRSKGLRARELFSDIDENIVRMLALDHSPAGGSFALSLLHPRAHSYDS